MKKDVGNILFQSITSILFTIFGILCFYPFYYILIYSISDPSQALKHNVYLLPAGFSLDSYKAVLSLPNIYSAAIVSILRVIIGTASSVFVTSMFAYVLANKELKMRKIMYRVTVTTMYLNAGLIPWYITMRGLGLKNNFFLYIFPYLIGAFNLILVKTYVEQMPPSLEESAQIDGAGPFTIFIKIIFPLCKPVVAAIIVFTAVFHWNAWTDNFYLVRDPHLQTLQLTLLNYLRESDNIANLMSQGGGMNSLSQIQKALTPTSIRMTLSIVVILPIILVYPFMQKYFVKGIMLGAVKG